MKDTIARNETTTLIQNRRKYELKVRKMKMKKMHMRTYINTTYIIHHTLHYTIITQLFLL